MDRLRLDKDTGTLYIKLSRDNVLAVQFYQQWTHLFKLPLKMNWYTLTFLKLQVERGYYKGSYFETEGWLLGLGLIVEWYDQAERDKVFEEVRQRPMYKVIFEEEDEEHSD